MQTNNQMEIDHALKYIISEEYSNGETILKNLISKNPLDFKAHYFLGWINERLNRDKLSKKFYTYAYNINSNFFDIDEKINGYTRNKKNINNDFIKIVKWAIKSNNNIDISTIIAKKNIMISKKLINYQISIKNAQEIIYNNTLKQIAKPYADELTMLLFDIGINLSVWGIMHPWNFSVAFNYLLNVSEAILNKEQYISKLIKKEKFNFIDLEILKIIKISNAVPVLLNMLNEKDGKPKENVINTIGVLNNNTAVFPLLNFLKKCDLNEVYEICLALARISDNNVYPIVKKYTKKYMNSEIAPLLIVCLCRLKEGKEGLLKLIKNSDISIREEAINQIADYRDKETVKILLKALFDETKISDFYPIRNIAYEKLEEIGSNYLKMLDSNFSNYNKIKELEKVFFCKKPNIEWVTNLINNW